MPEPSPQHRRYLRSLIDEQVCLMASETSLEGSVRPVSPTERSNHPPHRGNQARSGVYKESLIFLIQTLQSGESLSTLVAEK